jgi:hypothetical protein
MSFAALADDLQTVWNAPTTDARLKKRIVRTLIHEVVADIDTEAANGSVEIVLVIHWVGGVHTNLRLPRRRRGQRNSTPVETVEAIRQLALIANDDLIAGILSDCRYPEQERAAHRQRQSLDQGTGLFATLTPKDPALPRRRPGHGTVAEPDQGIRPSRHIAKDA